MRTLRLFVAAASLCAMATGSAAQTVGAADQAERRPPLAETPAVPPTTEEQPTPGEETADVAAIEAEIAAQELSGEAQTRLNAARDSVVQIQGFFEGSESSAFHGSGFAVDDGRRIVTNYHVVAQAVLYPQQYRLKYLASDGREGPLHVLAIDVRNDLAIVAADDLELPPLKLRPDIPA